jgi:protein-tyrosine phosphatase
MAEFLLQKAVARARLDWHIGSAGTHARSGLEMHPNTRKYLRSRGIAITDWHTRRVEPWMLDSSDLILTATRQHRSMIVGARPELLGRTFPLLQFAALAEAARKSGRWPQLVTSDRDSLATTVREVQGETQFAAMDADLADPVGHRYHKFRICGSTIDQAIIQILGT